MCQKKVNNPIALLSLLFHEFIFYLLSYPLWMARIFKSEYVMQLSVFMYMYHHNLQLLFHQTITKGRGGSGLIVSDFIPERVACV